MVRLTTGGLLDGTFGDQGRVTTAFTSGLDRARSVVVLPDNKIMVAGMVNGNTGGYNPEGGLTYEDIGLLRYTEQGMPDAALNGNGKVTIDIDGGDDDVTALKLTPDGKLVIAGNSRIVNGEHMAIALVRCSTDGILDPTFGNAGKVLTKFNPDGLTTGVSGLAVSASGELAVSGWISGDAPNHGFNVIKYLANGQLDYRFGSGGRVGTVFGAGIRQAAGVAFQNDGKIVAVGTVRDYREFGIARYKPQGIAAAGDYDGDGRAEIGVYRGSEGMWYLQNLVTGGKTYVRFGLAGDQPVPGDYDGDGKTDVAVFRPSNGTWYVNRSSDSQVVVMPFGLSSDTPLPGDYDGDGKTDFAVYRLATGTWYVLQSSTGVKVIKYGSDVAFPFPGDYDGDGQTDAAVYRPADKTWWALGSAVPVNVVQFGTNSDLPIPADYDGDQATDVAIFRNDGNWWVRKSENTTVRSDHWGISSDIPTPADFDGDGKADRAVFRSSTGVWYVLRPDGTMRIVEWGISGDIPVVGITFRDFA
jgi:uncharacterized delta-60 repeat protein